MINQNKLGLLFGAFLGALHLEWVGLVVTGLAKPLIDWIVKIHFIEMTFTMLPFSIKTAITLVVMTSVLGYVSGWILGFIWNALHGEFPSIDAIAPAVKTASVKESFVRQ